MSEDGGVRSVDDVNRLVSLMKDMNKLESRCTYLNVILNTEKRADILHHFVQLGGWKIMNEWLAEIIDFISQLGRNGRNAKIKGFDFSILIEDVLKALKVLPVDLEILKQNATPRLVKNLSKDSSLSDEVQRLASQVVQNWTDVIMREKKSMDEKEKAKNDQRLEAKNVTNKNSKTCSDSDHSSKSESQSDKDKSTVTPKKSSSAPGSKVKLTSLDLWGLESNVKEKKTVGKKEKRKHDNGGSVDGKALVSKDESASLKKFPATVSSQLTEGVSTAKKKKSEKDTNENSNNTAKSNASGPAKNSPISPQSPSKLKVESSSMDILGQIQAGMDKTKNSDISLKTNATSVHRVETNIKDTGLKTEKSSSSVVSTSSKSKQSNCSKLNVAPKPKPQIRHLSLVDDMFRDSVMAAPVVKKKKKLNSAMGVKAKNVSVVKSGSSSSDVNKPKVITSATAPVTKTPDVDENIKTDSENDNKEEGGSNDPDSIKDDANGGLKTCKGNKKGRSIRWKEDKDLVLIKVYELDEEERAMKSVFSSASGTETDSNSESYDPSNPMSASFFEIAKREMLLERKIRQRNNGSYSGLGPCQNYSADESFDNMKWVLNQMTLSDDMKVNRGHMSTEKVTQTLREQSVPAEVYPNLLTVPLSPKEPNYDANAMFAEKKEPIIIPYDDIEPQGMEIDNDSEPEQDVDERILHELFPNAAKKEKVSPSSDLSTSSSNHGAISLDASLATKIPPVVASNAISIPETDPGPPLQASATLASFVSSSLQTSNASLSSTVANSFSGIKLSNDELKISTSASQTSSLLPSPTSSVANNTPSTRLGTPQIQNVPFNTSSSTVISPTAQIPHLLQQPLNGLMSPGSSAQPPPNGLMTLNFNFQTQLPNNNNTFPFAASNQTAVSPPPIVGVSTTGPLSTNGGPTMPNSLYHFYPSNKYPYNVGNAISPSGGGNLSSPMFLFPQGPNAVIPTAPGVLRPNMAMEQFQTYGGNNPSNNGRSKNLCKYFMEGNCNHGDNCRFSHEIKRNDSSSSSSGMGNHFNYPNGSRNSKHHSSHKDSSNHFKPTHHQQQKSDNSFSKHNKHDNNNSCNNGSSDKSNDKNNYRENKNYHHRGDKDNWKNSSSHKSFSSKSRSNDKKR